jgi:hypothetical protein
MIIDFVSNQEFRVYIEMISDELVGMLSFFSIHMVTGTKDLLEKFLASEGDLLLLALMSTNLESLRCAMIKM